jgi:hypothetical protein
VSVDPDAMYGPDGLYNLLPSIYRTTDAEAGSPLRALLAAIQQQLGQLAAATSQAYLDWFIETCDDRLVPYFAELVGMRLGPDLATGETSPNAGTDADWRRRLVADAIADRRQKGTFSILERLTFDATGWLARAVELSGTGLVTRSARFPDVGLDPVVDIADGDALDRLGTPFAAAAALPDVRRLDSHRTPGTNCPGAVAVWVWRLSAERVTRAPATTRMGGGQFRFDPLGYDLQLCVNPARRAPGQAPVLDLDVPWPVTRAALARRPEDYYGPGLSLCVFHRGELIPRSAIEVADLTHWEHRLVRGRVAIDPELGRLKFDPRYAPEDGVSVTYSRLSMAAIGGGSYSWPPASIPAGASSYQVGPSGSHRSIGAAFRRWVGERNAGRAAPAVVIEVADDGVYDEDLRLELAPGEALFLRAAPGCRPVIVPARTETDRPPRLLIRSRAPRRVRAPAPASPAGSAGTGSAESRAASEKASPAASASSGQDPTQADLQPPSVTIEGLWVGNGAVELEGQLGTVTFRHCTLAPVFFDEHRAVAASLAVRAMPCTLVISSSALGPIRIASPEEGFDPVPLHLTDSVLAGTRPGHRAVSGDDGRRAYSTLHVRNATILGGASVESVEVIEDSIITGDLWCERRQSGTVRFSYVPPDSRTPRRVGCQPDGVRAAVDDAARRGEIAPADVERIVERESARVEPRFDATDFWAPAYARLVPATAREIIRGASDEGEMGAYHDLWQALKIEDLRSRLAEFSPVATEIAIRFAT